MKYYSFYFAQAYGDSAYGEGNYSCTTEQQANGTCTTTGGATSSNGGLANTGVAVLAVVTVACLIVFAALAVRIWRRPKPVMQEVTPPDEDEEDTTQPDNQV
jgi:hypothetical protein